MKIQKFPQFLRLRVRTRESRATSIFTSKIERKIISKETKIEELFPWKFVETRSSITIIISMKTGQTFSFRQQLSPPVSYTCTRASPDFLAPPPPVRRRGTCPCLCSPLLQGRNEQTNSDNCHRMKNNSR